MSDEGENLGAGENLPILASDAERDQAVELLRGAVVEGRLTLEEFTDRVGLAQTARTDRELAALSRDLPAVRTPDEVSAALSAEPHRHRATFSHLQRSGPWELVRRSVYRCVFGTIDLDLRQARLAGDEVEMEIHNVCGTVTLVVPEGIDVIVTGGGAFSSQLVDPPSAPSIHGAPRVLVRAGGAFGTLRVKHDDGASGRDIRKDLRS